MNLVSVFAPLRALLVTTALGLAFGLTTVLAIHYFSTARAAIAENAQLKEQMQSLVERLVDLEGTMARVAAERRAVDASSLAGFSSVVEHAGIEAGREAKVARALAPVSGAVPAAAVPSGSPFVALLDRFSSARSTAGSLAQDLAFTADVVSSRLEILRSLPAVMPAKGWISSEFGMRESPFHPGFVGLHNGIDVAADEGTPVVATGDGIVAFSGANGSFGKLVTIDHGFGLSTRYGHNSLLLVKRGERVVRGQTIATVGNTGRSTGAHVHYEVALYDKPVDPRRFLFDARPEDTAPQGALAGLARGGEATTALASAAAPAAGAKPGLGLEWDAPVFVVRGGLLFGQAPHVFRAATTGDVAMAVVALLLLAVASAVMRLPTIVRRETEGRPKADKPRTAADLILEFRRKQRQPLTRTQRLKAAVWGGAR